MLTNSLTDAFSQAYILEMCKAIGLIFSLFNITSPWHVPYTNRSTYNTRIMD